MLFVALATLHRVAVFDYLEPLARGLTDAANLADRSPVILAEIRNHLVVGDEPCMLVLSGIKQADQALVYESKTADPWFSRGFSRELSGENRWKARRFRNGWPSKVAASTLSRRSAAQAMRT
jgi:hypothetical protein